MRLPSDQSDQDLYKTNDETWRSSMNGGTEWNYRLHVKLLLNLIGIVVFIWIIRKLCWKARARKQNTLALQRNQAMGTDNYKKTHPIYSKTREPENFQLPDSLRKIPNV